jgi:hypothetical protein
LGASEAPHDQTAYLKELVNAGKDWEFAPPVPFEIASLSAEQKAADSKGREYTLWDVDGAAVFARTASAVLEALPECQARHNAAWIFA